MKSVKLLLSVVLLSTFTVLGPTPTSASCAGPEIDVAGKVGRGAPASAGDSLKVTGRYWNSGDCEDTDASGGGCAWFGQTEAELEAEDEQLYSDLILTLRGPLGRRSQNSIRLGVVPEMVGGRFSLDVVVPDVPDGVYEITNDRIDYAKIEIAIRSDR